MNIFVKNLCLAGLAATMVSCARTAQLPEQGKAMVEIVLPSAPLNWREKIALAEMTKLLRDITGEELKTVPAGEESAGVTHIYCQQAALDKLGIRSPLKEQEILVKVTPGAVYIAGGTRDGFVYAAYHFLENCAGVRWWSPGEKYIPSRPDLNLPDYYVRRVPDFILRASHGMASLDAFGYDYNVVKQTDGTIKKFKNCRDRSIPSNHNIIPYYFGDVSFKDTLALRERDGHGAPFVQNEDDFRQHPEWFAETAGKRSTAARDMCYSCPAAAEALGERVMRKIALDRDESRASDMPPPFIYSLSRDDNAAWCQCARCQAAIKRTGYSGLLIQFLNLAAVKVKEKYPDILLSTLAYQNTADAPVGVVPADNLAIVYCFEKRNIARPLVDASNERTLREVRQWAKITANLFVWDYVGSFASWQTTPGLFDFPSPSMLHFADDHRLLKQIGVKGVFAQNPAFGNRDPLWSLRNWMLSKVYFDTSLDNETLLRSFLSGYYGPAWQGMRDYIQCLADADKRRPSRIWFYADLCEYHYLDVPFFQAAQAAYDHAESLAGAAQPFLDRVRASRFTLDRALLYRYPILMREWRLAGHQTKDFPLGDYDAVLSKAKERFVSLARINPRGIFPATPWNEVMKSPMEEIRLALPEGFAAIAVADYPVGKYYYKIDSPAVLDHDSAGNVVCRMSLENFPLPLAWCCRPRWGEAQWEFKENSVMSGRLRGDQMKRGQQWYRLGTYEFDGTSSGLQFFRGKLKLWVDVIGKYDAWANLCLDDDNVALSRIILVAPGSVPAI